MTYAVLFAGTSTPMALRGGDQGKKLAEPILFCPSSEDGDFTEFDEIEDAEEAIQRSIKHRELYLDRRDLYVICEVGRDGKPRKPKVKHYVKGQDAEPSAEASAEGNPERTAETVDTNG